MTTLEVPVSAQQLLRLALGRFATGVTVVTTSDRRITYGVTVNSFTSVSLDPPLVLWCLHRNATSLAAFLHAKHFAINVLSAEQAPLAQRFSQPVADRFDGVPLAASAHDLPVLAGSAATIICRRHDVRTAGDHLVILGEVIEYDWTPGPTLGFLDGTFFAAI